MDIKNDSMNTLEVIVESTPLWLLVVIQIAVLILISYN